MKQFGHLCSWCRLPSESGQIRDSQWVCHICFPVNGGKNRMIQGVRKCESCGRKNNEGEVILSRWICSSCSSFFSQQPVSMKGRPKKGHVNKYANFSKAHPADYVNRTNQPHKKRKNKGRHPKLKKITYWTVIIEDISTGDL